MLHLMRYRGNAFYKFFSSHCFLNALWSTLLLCPVSVVGAPSGDCSYEACDCLGRNGRRPFVSILLPFNLLILHHRPFFPSFLAPLPFSNSSGYMVQWVPSVTPSLHRLLTSYLSPSPQIFQTPAALS